MTDTAGQFGIPAFAGLDRGDAKEAVGLSVDQAGQGLAGTADKLEESGQALGRISS